MNLQHDIDDRGFAFRRQALDAGQLDKLFVILCPATEPSGIRRRAGGTYAARNVLWEIPGLAAALTSVGLDAIAAQALGKPPFPINATYFDKNADANWKVPPHQDLMMPVERQVAEAGFCGWSTKLGVLYVEPSAEILSSLIALRVHFDPAPASNGALAVAPGSHRRGKLRDAEVVAIAPSEFTTCDAAAGDVLLMRPLLVHRSAPAQSPSHRRILHVVYATEHPGGELRWKCAG
jgi:hypothetical protein